MNSYCHRPLFHRPRTPLVSNAIHRYHSAPVGHVFRVAELTEAPKAAGAIVSSFASHEKLLVMARGARAVYAAVKAIASARFMALRGGEEGGFDIAMQPVLQPAPRNTPEVHQIRIYLYKVPVSRLSLIGQEKVTAGRRQMRVGALTDPRALGGAITTTLLSDPQRLLGGAMKTTLLSTRVDECECLAAGFAPVYRAVRGVAVARHVMLRKHYPWQGEGRSTEQEERFKGDLIRGYGQGEPARGARFRPFPHQARQRARISARDFGPRDREAMDLMAFVGWRDFEEGKKCVVFVLKACDPGHLEGGGRQEDGDGEDDLVAPRI